MKIMSRSTITSTYKYKTYEISEVIAENFNPKNQQSFDYFRVISVNWSKITKKSSHPIHEIY